MPELLQSKEINRVQIFGFMWTWSRLGGRMDKLADVGEFIQNLKYSSPVYNSLAQKHVRLGV